MTFNYLDFFTETPISGCSVLECDFGDSCGTTAISQTSIGPASATTPFTLTYKQDVQTGYGPHSVCVQCTATNNELDSFTFSNEQLPLDCIPPLVANAQTAIIYPYVEGSTG